MITATGIEHLIFASLILIESLLFITVVWRTTKAALLRRVNKNVNEMMRELDEIIAESKQNFESTKAKIEKGPAPEPPQPPEPEKRPPQRLGFVDIGDRE